MQKSVVSMQRGQTRRLVMLGMITTVAFGLSFVETFLTLPFMVPGMKLGLANVALLFALYIFDAKAAVLVGTAKLILSALLFGNPISILCSTVGTVCALVVSISIYKFCKPPVLLLSICAAIAHNVGQLLVVAFLVNVGLVMSYAPILILEGAITGTIVGIVARYVVMRAQSFMGEKN